MRLKSIIIGAFFGLLIVIGLLVYKDYGISWDESIQRSYGLDVYNYVFNRNERLFKNKDRYYGPVVEFSQVFLEKTFSVSDIQYIYQLRRLFNFTLFVFGVFFFYLLLVKRFKSVWWGLLGSMLLILSPRIFAHAFYNSKDISFMVFFIIASYFGVIFLQKRETLIAILIAFLSAVLIDIRIMGALFPVLLVSLFFLNTFKREHLKLLLLYFFLTVLFAVILWPTLWEAPLENFLAAFDQMRNYPQKTSILYFGEKVSSVGVPWHYTLGWIAVTTPLIYLVASAVGLIRVPRRPYRNIDKQDLLMAGWLFVPLIAVILLKSTLYDAWRQMFFIYPPILYFAVYGLVKASSAIRRVLFVLLIINLYFVTLFMVREHPFQNLYFNELVRTPYEKKFELDYWGLSYKRAYEEIARIDKRPLIKVFSENLPGETNLLMLPKADRERFEHVKDRSLADYYLTNYRQYKDGYYDPVFYFVEVNGTRILGVHRLK